MIRHLMAAEALVSWRLTAERLQERIYQLEAIARLNGETILGVQRAAAQIERAQWSRRYVSNKDVKRPEAFGARLR